MQINEVREILGSLFKGQFGINVVVSMPCDNKFRACGKYLIGRVRKVTIITNARLGVKYESKVIAKGDGSNEWESAPLRGFTWVDYPYIKASNKDGALYLNINYRNSDTQTRFRSVYLLDGKLATAAEVAEIEGCMKSSSTYSKKQAAYGIANEEEQTKVVSYKVDYIEHIGTDKEFAESIFESLTK